MPNPGAVKVCDKSIPTRADGNPNFTSLVEKSLDPEDNAYQKVSASWEVGFNDFVLAVGSDILSDAKIVSDPE